MALAFSVPKSLLQRDTKADLHAISFNPLKARKAHLGLNKKLTPKILTSKIRHENDDIFKNALSKKGLE
jgi:hypothetical protein